MNMIIAMQEDLTVLSTWAPLVLRQGAQANPDDLADIIRRRSRVEQWVADLAEGGDMTPFYLLLRADRACAEYVHGLLYLNRERAEEAARAGAQDVGGGWGLNACAWWGVHEWGLVREGRLGHWAGQIAQAYGEEVHEAEVLQAFHELSDYRGDEYVNQFFFDSNENWREYIDTEDRSYLYRAIIDRRSRALGSGDPTPS